MHRRPVSVSDTLQVVGFQANCGKFGKLNVQVFHQKSSFRAVQDIASPIAMKQGRM